MQEQNEGCPGPEDGFYRQMLLLNGLRIPEEWRAEVARYFCISWRMARQLQACPMDLRDEPAPVFRA